ncbi:hypothetical protein LCGC14_3099130, partial [marine sediment metagenome]
LEDTGRSRPAWQYENWATFLEWQKTEIKWAKRRYGITGAIEMQRFTTTYPAEAVVSSGKLFMKLGPLARTLSEQAAEHETKKASDKPEIPVTLREFMDLFCTPKLKKNIRDSRVMALQSAARRKVITLPKHEGKWAQGRSKKYSPIALVKEWPSYQQKFSLPELESNSRPS